MTIKPKTWRALVIDDNPDIHADIGKCLSGSAQNTVLDSLEDEFFGGTSAPSLAPNFELTSAMQGEAGVEHCSRALKEGRPFSMALVDMRMPPGIDGLETIQRLWRVDPQLQIILCTAFSDHSWTEISRRLGARDNLLVLRKPFEAIELQQMALALCEKRSLESRARARLDELERAVAERTAELVEARQRDQERLESLEEVVDRRTVELRREALHDRLTGLPNRGFFAELVNKAIERSRAHPGVHYAVLYLDCDRFKVVNDSLGHAFGDRLLCELGARLEALCQDIQVPNGPCERATAARLGGDEFAVLISGALANGQAFSIAKTLLERLTPPLFVEGNELRLQASVGIANSVQNYQRAEDVIRDADVAMYRAKSSGRGKIVEFTPEMHASVLTKLVLETELRKALDSAQIGVAYQPIVDLNTGDVVALECLARWTRPVEGPVLPSTFIPLAEECGLIVPLGEHVLSVACEQLAAWQKVLHPSRVPTVSINVSRKQLVEAHFANRVKTILDRTGARPEKIVLEITESMVMENVEASVDVLQRLRALGIGFYKDDFGTGHSSLSCLQHFPLTGLKIDQSFTSGDRKEPYRTAVAQAIIAVARNLGIPAIAEGAETVEDVAWLQALGCERAQGFFFSRPVLADEIVKLLGQPTAWSSFEGVRDCLAQTRSAARTLVAKQ